MTSLSTTLLALLLLHAAAPAQTPPAQPAPQTPPPNQAQRPDKAALQQAAAANSLTAEGKLPFHLKVEFQLFDLSGKPSETGTIEQWWLSPGVQRLVITSPSVNYTILSEADQPDTVNNRARYLVDELLQQELHPIPDLSRSPLPVSQKTRSFGKLDLSCYVSINFQTVVSGAPMVNYCVDPSSLALRAKLEEGVALTAHNRPATFHGTNVAMDIQMTYQEHVAIQGKIVDLRSFDPTDSNLAFTHSPPPPPSDPAAIPNRADPNIAKSGVIAGKIMSRVSPSYPLQARLGHITGTVILHGVIAKDGALRHPFAIASPSPILTNAAVDAVEKWTYQPYLLNGKPVEVDTTIYVNFNLR